MEGGWDRPCGSAMTLRERYCNKEPLAEGKDNNNDEYDEDGNIPNNDDKYVVGLTVLTSPLTSPLTRAMSSLKLLVLCLRKRALRVSGQACPHKRASYSQRRPLRI
jgi:hypothetical protein